MLNRDKLWTKDFILITVISFFIFFAFYILIAVLPLYLVDSLKVGADKVGLVVTLFLLAAILVRPFSGQWVSKYSQKKILVYASVAFLIATMLYPFATNIGALLLLRIFHGITFGIMTTVKGTICAELIPTSRRGEGLSYFSMAMGLAMVIGPYLGLNMVSKDAYNTAFIICMIISAVNVILAQAMKIPEKTEKLKAVSTQGRFEWKDLFDKKAAPFALSTFILACAYSGVSAFLSVYAKELGLIEAASYFFLTYAVFLLLARPFTGRWADKFGTKVIIYPCLILFAVGMFLLSQAHSSAIILIAGAIIGIGYGSVTPIFQAQTIGSVEPHRVGIANSLFFNSMDAGMALGAYVLGIIAGYSGYHSIFLVGVAFILVAGIQYFTLTQKKTDPVVTEEEELGEPDEEIA